MLFVVNASTFSNLGFLRKISNRLPGEVSSEGYALSIGGIPYRRMVAADGITYKRVKKSGLDKPRRWRNALTDTLFPVTEHFDQPLLYRTNPLYAMKPDVMNRIRILNEIRPN